MTHDLPHAADIDLFGEASPHPADLDSFLPVKIARSNTGMTHIADKDGATFLDRAYQLRGFVHRPGFKDEFEILAPQIVDRLNRFGEVEGAAGEALEALQGLSGIKLPGSARKALGRALMALAAATKGR